MIFFYQFTVYWCSVLECHSVQVSSLSRIHFQVK